MQGNTFGSIFRITTFGESHGKAIGGIIDGCPPGIEINLAEIAFQLSRRRPGQSSLTTQRNEEDHVEFLSGLMNGISTGAPIGFMIKNNDQQPKDYDNLKDVFRPSHADFTYQAKYGIRDHRGGGRSSARETACRVVAGAVASQILKKKGVKIYAYVSAVGQIVVPVEYTMLDLTKTDTNLVRCPHAETAALMQQQIEKARNEGNSLGGVITGVIQQVPVGLGEPVFDKFHSRLGMAMLTINAVKGFEYGSGFSGTRMKGSEHNDDFIMREGKVHTSTNRSGGIQGGITNGEDVYFKVGFKPTATIMSAQRTITSAGEAVEMKATGRHDPCVLPRAVPIVEAMAALVTLDFYLLNKTINL
ncbi:MAG: chorismate synthase [Flavobacteriales bacterium]